MLPHEKEEKDSFPPQNSSLVQTVGQITSLENLLEKPEQIISVKALVETFPPQKVTLQQVGNVHPPYRAWIWRHFLHARDPGMMGQELLTTGKWIFLAGYLRNLEKAQPILQDHKDPAAPALRSRTKVQEEGEDPETGVEEVLEQIAA